MEIGVGLVRKLYADYEDLISRHNELIQQHKDLKDQCNEAEDGIEQQTAFITALERRVLEKEAVITHLETRQGREATPASDRTMKTTKLPDPPVFFGTVDPLLDDWLSKMKSKLSANQDHYPTEALRMGYVENRVGGNAIKHLAPRLRTGSTNPFVSTEDMFEVLERVYGDPNRRQTASAEFRRLYQGGKDFNSFWAEFQRLAAGIDYSSENLVDELRSKVSAELERAIITETGPADIYALARKCQLYDQNIQKVKAREARTARRRQATTGVYSLPASDATL